MKPKNEEKIKHWGIGESHFICGVEHKKGNNICAFGIENVTCIECLKVAWNNPERTTLKYVHQDYPWILDKIKQLEYNKDFDQLIGDK